MTKLSILPLILAISASAASAQDEVWSGPYVGIYTGANAASTEMKDNWCWASCDAPDVNAVQPTVGGTLGYNFQIDDSFVVGVEADFGSGVSARSVSPEGDVSNASFVADWNSRLDWIGTGRARAGLAAGNTLAYVTGGIAVGKAKFFEISTSEMAWPAPQFGSKWSGTMTGYVYGAGIEHSFGRVSVKAELLQSTFGSRSACIADIGGPNDGICWNPPENVQNKNTATPSVTALRLGLNLRF